MSYLSAFTFVNEQTFLYFALTAFILACFRGCLLRIPYATILSTLISTCGLIIGLAALFDATTILEKFTLELLERNFVFFNDLKVGYIFVALFIIIVIIFNLVIGFVATDQSVYKETDPTLNNANGMINGPNNLHGHNRRRKQDCCAVTCLKSSTAVFLLQTFLAFNYIIYYVLLLITIVSFIALYTSYVATILCNEGTLVNLNAYNHSKIPGEDEKLLDLRQFAPVIGLKWNETQLLEFRGARLQKLCSDYVTKLGFHVILSTIGFMLACAGFVNYLINFSVNSAKLSTKQKFTELLYLNSELAPFDARY